MSEYGLNAGVAMGFQSSFGTALTSSLHFIPFLTENIGIDQPPLISENLTGIFDEAADFAGPRTVAGDISADAHPISLGMMISAVLGRPTTSAAGAAYSHLWKPRTTDFDTYAANNPITYYKDMGVGSAMLFADLVGSMLELSVANGELTKATVTFVGGRFSQIAAIAKSLPTGRPAWPWSVSSVSFAGVATPEIRSFTLKINEGIEASHTLNASLYPSRTKRSGFRTVSVEGSMFFDDQNHYQRFLNSSEHNFTITMKGNGPAVSSGYTEDLTIICPAFRHREFKPEVAGPTQNEVSFTAAAKYLQSSATAVQITLINSLSGY